MELTQVSVYTPHKNAPDFLIANVTLEFDNVLVVRSVSFLKSQEGEYYFKMCQYKKNDGTYGDNVFIKDKELYGQIRDSILNEISNSKYFDIESPTAPEKKSGGGIKNF